MRVAVLGAAGLVGNVLVRRLIQDRRADVRACVRNPSTAWTLIRHGIPTTPADLRDEASLAAALEGCTHVVNCALGEDRELVPCMKNLVSACRHRGVVRLVHLSSVTVYGDPPSADAVSELAVPRPKRGSYGWHKMRQDEIAARAHRSGLSTAVLCLPHVTGPGSRFLLSLIRELRACQFALIDGGRHPVVMADVENVSCAIESALEAPAVDGQRLFINDGPAPSWATLVSRLAPLAGIDACRVPRLTADEARASRTRSLGMLAAARQMVGVPAVREILAQTRLGTDSAAIRLIKSAAKRRLATDTTDRAVHPRPSSRIPAPGLWMQQLRMVDHSTARAAEGIGYRPRHDFPRSIEAFERWYRSMFLYGSDFWDLAKRIGGAL